MTRITADWINAPASRAVMTALGAGYFVGGCIRNALLGAPVADIDIATPLVPDEVTRRLNAAGMKAIPTGLAHGTVTAIHDGTPIQVTTFRKDVETFGRHATVAYTAEMAEDAARRDFTMNAIYADAAGEIIDPLGGMADLEARRVRFIGAAEDRIREDYLRILRFFRFHAWYGGDGLDPDGLAACAAMADGLDELARERVGWEFRKLLSARDPAPATAAMAAAGILARCLPGADAGVLAPLVHVERTHGQAPDWHTRLVAMGGETPVARLRLSRAEASLLSDIRKALGDDDPALAAYHYGAPAARAAALIRAAAGNGELPRDLEQAIARGSHAELPVTATDFLAEGVRPGPALGARLSAAEARWIASGFALDKAALLENGD